MYEMVTPSWQHSQSAKSQLRTPSNLNLRITRLHLHKYLGVRLNNHLDYQNCVTALPDTDLLAKYMQSKFISGQEKLFSLLCCMYFPCFIVFQLTWDKDSH